MKRIHTLFLLLIFLSCLSACGYESSEVDTQITNQSKSMVNADDFTEEYIIDCLEKTPNVTDVAAVTKEYDPNGNLNAEGGYYAAVYFAVDIINQEEVYGDNLIDKGTDAGGCVEAYKSKEDAEVRNQYLTKFDDSWLFNSGSHVVVESLVVRTSKELSVEDQKQLENNVIAMLVGDKVGEPIKKTSYTEEPPAEQRKKVDGKIEMPYDTSDYIGAEWTIEAITKHFEELGFTNIRAVPCDPDDDDYRYNIFEMVIETGLFSTDPWGKGDEFDADAEISIYYNELPLLTADNCPDLLTVLTSKELGYMTFCNRYDGRYVEFDAYVVGHLTYDGGTSHIIDVSGGDYDGKTEIDAYDPSTYAGLIIRIGDRAWDSDINKGVDVGDHVTVSGRIDASWADYFKCVYVETLNLSKR